MKRYVLRLSYIGTYYRGSQKHVNDIIVDIDSIQGAIESSLMKLLPHPPNLVLAGRTDAGVHATCTVAHIDLEHRPEVTYFDTTNLVRMMNRYFTDCGHDIRILSCREVSNNFHARFSAKSRTYLYRFLVAKDPKDHRVPISELKRTLHLQMHSDKFDIEKLKKGIDLFQGTKDFRSFTGTKRINRTESVYKESYVRQLQITLEKGEPLMPFDPLSNNFNYWNIIFTSQSFLYNQIRRIVGALLALSTYQVTEEDITTMLQVPSRYSWISCIATAPPHGLYLMNVEYNQEFRF